MKRWIICAALLVAGCATGHHDDDHDGHKRSKRHDAARQAEIKAKKATAKADKAAAKAAMKADKAGKAGKAGKLDKAAGDHKFAEKQIRVLRMAMDGLLAAEKHQAAEQVEHAIHAKELMLEGRRDEEAVRIQESAPPLGAMVELTMYAADLLDEQGKPDRADMVDWLSQHYRKQWKRNQAKGKAKGKKGAPRTDVEMLLERIEQLEMRVRELERERKRHR